jgi:hypothetical protein
MSRESVQSYSNDSAPVYYLSLCHNSFESQVAYAAEILVAPSGVLEPVGVSEDSSLSPRRVGHLCSERQRTGSAKIVME